jgi:hypothetical protein
MTCTDCHRHVRAAAVAGVEQDGQQWILAGAEKW